METELIVIGKANAKYNASFSRILGYSLEMYHKGLNEHKILTAPFTDILENKANLQIQKWGEKWEYIENKRRLANTKEANIEEAELKTEEAQEKLFEIENILIHTLSVDDTTDWNKLKDKKRFPEKNPDSNLDYNLQKIQQPIKTPAKSCPEKPEPTDIAFLPEISFVDKIFPSLRQKKEKIANDNYNKAVKRWEEWSIEIDNKNEQNEKQYEKELLAYELIKKNTIEENKKLVIEWTERKNNYLKTQEEYNQKIEQLKIEYFDCEEAAINEYCQMVLNNSEYPEFFPKNFELEYNPNNKLLIVEYEFPSIELFPKVKEVKYLSSRNELKESNISDVQLNKMFDDAIYKITLRTIHELYEADKAKAIDVISFNGWVRSINKGTGKEENNCILTIQVKKEEFLEIDLAKIDPKICFKNLKGVASSKLSSLTPIQPILQINKNDKRFVDGNQIIDSLENSMNIASMDWEDFEHLIRELFEKEFQSNGGEVKVTQASRDGGVDAIAFDPDPIRGGKIVIQAKRYTNTVGVSAVRDLYGTLMNEGATKGILVSTADYGPDAYDFAKGKPITLLSGSNLLFLLEKHGYHAKIDLREAKRIFNEQKN